MATKRRKGKKNQDASVAGLLRKHFGRVPLQNLVTASRTFPVTARADLQRALEQVFARAPQVELVGAHRQYGHDTMTFADLVRTGHDPVVVSPLQHEDIDVGDSAPVRCLRHGLWLARTKGVLFALLSSPAVRYGQSSGVHVEIAVAAGGPGLELSRDLFAELDELVNRSSSYRGKVLSLEQSHNYSGIAGQIRVHRLRSINREEVILPDRTLRLLERNVSEFVAQRQELGALGMAAKKGLLFYGPPGTGKTHTIHYLASQLPGHTTLLITAQQVGLLSEYFQLARFLQPAMIVIEDVDLIARDRNQTRGACDESLLNQLLNEMDGLREDAALLFVLTTNRPEELEAALAARPGRIDQAIEFPLPDAEGRRKLVALYARELPLSEEVIAAIVRKTARASAAFIKELMRRCAQYLLRASAGSSPQLSLEHVESALDEMLLAGGSLNVKLLGGAAAEA
jgi:hypothetical protein